MCIGEADAPASAVIGLNVINVIDANQSDGQWKILSPWFTKEIKIYLW
jgi:hypothetical protein